jgi:hypothetical protein
MRYRSLSARCCGVAPQAVGARTQGHGGEAQVVHPDAQSLGLTPLPNPFTRVITEYSLAPSRLGLTATPERSEGKRAVLYEVVAEATGEEQVSRRRRQGPHVSPAPQRGGRAPDLCAAGGDDDEPVSSPDRHGQEDARSYPPSC